MTRLTILTEWFGNGKLYLDACEHRLSCGCFHEPGDLLPHGLNDTRHNRVAKLPVRLRVGYRDIFAQAHHLVESHQPRRLDRGQPTRVTVALAGYVKRIRRTPRNEDFRAVLVVPCGQRPGDAVKVCQAEGGTA